MAWQAEVPLADESSELVAPGTQDMPGLGVGPAVYTGIPVVHQSQPVPFHPAPQTVEVD